MMKKSLILTLVLSALLLVTVMAVSVSADASLTIGEIDVVKDTAKNLVTFTVPYTAVEVDQITVIAVKGSADAAPAPTEANIVYFNQQSSASNSFTFSVPYDAFSDAPYCWIKIGGTAIVNASNAPGEEIWVTAGVLVYGDVNGDENVDITDAILVTKFAAAMAAQVDPDPNDFPNGTFEVGSSVAADVNGDENVDITDAILVTKYAAAMAAQVAPDPNDFPNGKFEADNN